MKISKTAINRPVTTIMVMLIVLIFGFVSYTRIPLDMFPQMDIPIAVVSTSYSGVGPSEIESLVTEPLEDALGTVSDLKEITSISSNGSSMVVLEFEDGTDMDIAAQDVRELVDRVKGMLPDECDDPMVLKLDLGAMPIMLLSISGEEDLVQLKQLVDDEIQPSIERVGGVASVSISGAKEKEIKITLNPDKLTAYGLTTSQISQLLRAENLNLPVGDVDLGNQVMNVRSVGEFNSVDEIRNLPITTAAGSTIYLRDVAEVEDTYKEMESYSYLNGTPSILLSIQKQSTANTVQTAKGVYEVIDQIKEEFPNLQYVYLMDQSDAISRSIDSVVDSALQGGILAIFILFIFLRNFRSTLIIGISIPVSIVATFVLMLFGGLTLNVISLGGLTLGIGMLVDNSIVVLENIFRHREDGKSRKESAFIGVSEVSSAVVASTLTTIAVFLPMVFTEGMVAKMFRDMSLTVTFALVASLVVAITVVPMLSSRLLRMNRQKKKTALSFIPDGWEKVLNKIDAGYKWVLKGVLHHRIRTGIIVLIIFVGSLLSAGGVGMELMPDTDEGSISINISMPNGTDVDRSFEVVDEVKGRISDIPEIQDVNITVNKNTGMSLMGDQDSASFSIDVGSLDERERSTEEIVEEMRQRIMNSIPGTDISVEAQSSSMGGGTSSAPISIEITGDDNDALNRVAEDFVKIVSGVEGTREVTSDLEEGLPEAQIHIDRNKASVYGLNTSTIASTLQSAVNGSVATTYKVDGEEIDVRVIYDESKVEYLKDVNNIKIQTPTGATISLADVAEISMEKSPNAINRVAQNRVITVNCDLFGIDMNAAQQNIDARLQEYNLPEGISYSFAGEFEDMMESFSSLFLALILAVILVYMVMASQFESLLHPFTIMFSVPLALTGALFALFITGNPISLPAIIGMIMLVGIVVNNAIVLVDYVNQLRQKGFERTEAILEAGPTRLRPILMTAMTTILAMIPMALGLGEGTQMMAPMAIAVIGGLSASTVLTLVVVPLIYTFFDDIHEKSAARKKRRKEKRRAKEEEKMSM